MNKRVFLLVALLLSLSITVVAQVTTSSINGKVTTLGEEVIGATVTAKHVPSGAIYRTITNIEGLYSIENMRAGGPYDVEVSYIGSQTKRFTDLELPLGQSTVLNVYLDTDVQQLQEVQIISTGRSSMRTDRAGAVTSISAVEMTKLPTASRSLYDVMRMTPTGANTGNGFAVGGGNFRQSAMTVDGAAFNNSFGLNQGGKGSSMPGGGAAISIDALEQISVSTSPFDVRQSGFTGGAINAVTKSGTNEFKGSAYSYITSNQLRGRKVGDYELPPFSAGHDNTYGLTLGGPIVKDKLFFFINGEFEDRVSAGPTYRARTSDSEPWDISNNAVHRPTVQKLDEIKSYLASKYGYNPGGYQGYSSKAPAYKFLARIDWNIDDNNKLNVRFSKSKVKSDSAPTSSVSPLSAGRIYPGNGSTITSGMGLSSNAAIYMQSQRYSKDYNFTSVAAEWNSKWGIVNNSLRFTYSDQNEPRTYEGGVFPTVHIVEDGALYTAFGPDLFTAGNMARAKNFVATDELTFSLGIHKLTTGLQYETNSATNGFMQAGNGMFIYDSWNNFVNNPNQPYAYLVTFAAIGDGSQFISKMKQNFFSAYIQDQMNLSDRFRLTAGVRFEKPIYPALTNNYNHEFASMTFGTEKYETNQLPSSSLTISPRIGFNWDVLGDEKLVVRGGTGYFVGRLPFVWLISAVGNSNCGQVQYSYTGPTNANLGMPTFSTNVKEQLSTVDISSLANNPNPAAPTTPTIIDRNLKMNAVWKTSLAVDWQLPHDFKFSLEGLYSREFNPAVVNNLDVKPSVSTQTIAPGDTRATADVYGQKNTNNQTVTPYYITNAGNKAYYYSITASLSKSFDFGLNLNASYTYSHSRTYSDGIGDQVTSAYATNRYSRGPINGNELGYGTFVSPNRLLLSATYHKEYGKHFASTVGLVYEGMNMGYAGTYPYARYSYCLDGHYGNYSQVNVSTPTDSRAGNALMYIPESRAALDAWNFADITEKDGNVYTAAQQRDDFWAYIQQDSYLKKHTGEYAERGGAVMPWHHQLDFKFMQDFYLNIGGKRNTLQLGVDIENVLNLINKNWGTYKQIQTLWPLVYDIQNGAYTFPKVGNAAHSSTYNKYADANSTYRIMFSIRYIFN